MTLGLRKTAPLVLLAGCLASPRQIGNDAGFVHWIGVDSRPLAVGCQLTVNFEIESDGGTDVPYLASSSAPEIIGVQDQGNGQLLLSVLSAGAATLELQTPYGLANLPLLASLPASLMFYDIEHLATGIDLQLDPTFDLLSDSQERLQGVVMDGENRSLNSWGLITGDSSAGDLLVSEQQPEQFILAPGKSNAGGFVASLVDAGAPQTASADGGSSTASFAVKIVASASFLSLLADSTGYVVLAKALDADGKTEVFGIDDWQFDCIPMSLSATCTFERLSPAAVRVSVSSGYATLTVSSASQNLTRSLLVP